MLNSELATAIAEGIKVNIILFDNMTNGCINNLEIGHGQGSYGTELRFRNPKTGQLDGGFVPVDFAMNAASFGLKTYKVKTAEELREGRSLPKTAAYRMLYFPGLNLRACFGAVSF